MGVALGPKTGIFLWRPLFQWSGESQIQTTKYSLARIIYTKI